MEHPRAHREHLHDLPQAGHQRVDLLPGVVEGEGGARRGRDAEAVHHRLRAVMPRADRDPLVVEDRADVVGVDAVEDEGEDAGLLGARCR